MNWYLYLVQCQNGSLYSGITTCPSKRLKAHQSGKGARYTRMHGAQSMRLIACCLTRSQAARLEHQLKQLPVQHKRQLWANAPSQTIQAA